ncbi:MULTISPECIES: FcoT family thioesterase [Kitasatospora]|uniref:(2E)-enoyl-[ACP] glycyltransferase n=1 Tax=Kitasatospora cathayae TaxID=3004092 RepID=A0ABY7PXN4_9ACTN|nr:FcoT family thioesterase [Kitasatospora sp. HUAS 3-15]WBP85197.1 hypothetical protein O1G21_04560 [Kitasatospora sp. HUAS 3-15]
MPFHPQSLPLPGTRADAARTDRALLDRVLAIYKDDCRYLTWAEAAPADHPVGYPLRGAGQFTIRESCYVDAPGSFHLNAVEFNICFNQIMYYLIAAAVHDRLAAPFSSWTMDDFWQRQRPDILIIDFHSTFRSPVTSRNFQGETTITGVHRKNGRSGPFLLVDMTCGFSDRAGGNCHGEVTLAIIHPPQE